MGTDSADSFAGPGVSGCARTPGPTSSGTRRVAGRGSLATQDQVDGPTAPDMGARSAAVTEHVFVVAPGIHQRVSQYRQAIERPVLVDAFGKGQDGGGQPGR